MAHMLKSGISTIPMRRISLVLLASILLISGCQSYREGGSRTVGEFTDDVAIQTRVKSALIGDEEIKGLPINVEVVRGVVTLYGPIPSDYARSKAVNIVRAIRGVSEVRDRLTVTGSG